jgi:hypothetical protein
VKDAVKRIGIALVAVAVLVLPSVLGYVQAPPPQFLLKWGSLGSGDGQFHFNTRSASAVDVSNNVYGTNKNNYRVQKFGALSPVALTVNESISVSDAPQILLPVAINVTEAISVSDTPQILPPVAINVTETISVSDTAGVVPPVVVTVNESIAVTDSSQVGPATGTTVSGTVTLQGRTATFPTGVGHGIARVTLNPGGATVNVNADGSFQFSNVGAGTFTLDALAAGYVSRQRTNVVVAASPVTVPSVQLRCGLVNSDNFVNINDITATVASFGKTLANRVDALGRFVDQNGDTFVNINDITCVVSGFGVTSPLPWP